MKKNLTKLFFALSAVGSTFAQTSITGPSSSQSPYLQPIVAGSSITSIFTSADVINGYTMTGLADGVGAFDNGDGTFSMLITHEVASNNGAVRAHGATGAFVSKWIINKNTLAVISGTDLIQNVNLWTGTSYTIHNATNPSTLTAFGRFCSADLPAISAFYNAASGKGTTNRIFMGGEETGAEGRVFAHIASGPEAGNTYQLPNLGRASWENNITSPYAQDKTIVIGTDDATPGQVYVYVGNKQSTGNDITKAGLTGGKLYGVAVLGLINESSSGVPAPNTTFNLLDLGAVQNITGSTMNTNSNNLGITNFLRPEDGAWDPSNPRDFYFVTTNSFTSPSRLWRLRFHDIKNPELGGTATAMLTGNEGQKMLDNIGMNNFGQIMMQEDPGNQAHIAKIWQFNTSNNSLSLFAQHDTTRFITGQANFLTQDEESSGIVDAQEVLGPGMWLMVDQAHYSLPSPVLEGGQILAMYNPSSANANPEISVQGNNTNIAINSTITNSNNNTNYGLVNIGNELFKTFEVKNAGPGPLSVSNVSIGGINAGDYQLISPTSFPALIQANNSLTLTVRFAPAISGVRKGMISVMSNDFDEPVYSYAIEGNGVTPEINVTGNNSNILNGSGNISVNDNTDLGTTFMNIALTKTFAIQNTGTGTLKINGLTISGNSSFEFSFINPGTFPNNINAGSNLVFTVQYLPVTIGTRTAAISILSDDADESNYNFVIGAKSTIDVGINSVNSDEINASIYPNPAAAEAILKINANKKESAEILITDIVGKQVLKVSAAQLEAGENNISLNTTSLANGEYFVTIKKSDFKATLKLVVSH